MKLAVFEQESAELRATLKDAEKVFTSEVSEIEVRRAARRKAGELGDTAARHVMAKVTTVELDRQARLRAVALLPATMRTLDAIQIATALGLNLPDVVFVGYDRRLQEAAASAGLEIRSPGA